MTMAASFRISNPIPIPSKGKTDLPKKLPPKIESLIESGYLLVPIADFKGSNPVAIQAAAISKSKITLGDVKVGVFIKVETIKHKGKFTTLSFAGSRNMGKGGFSSLEMAATAVPDIKEMVLKGGAEKVDYSMVRKDSFEQESATAKK